MLPSLYWPPGGDLHILNIFKVEQCIFYVWWAHHIHVGCFRSLNVFVFSSKWTYTYFIRSDLSCFFFFSRFSFLKCLFSIHFFFLTGAFYDPRIRSGLFSWGWKSMISCCQQDGGFQSPPASSMTEKFNSDGKINRNFCNERMSF